MLYSLLFQQTLNGSVASMDDTVSEHDVSSLKKWSIAALFGPQPYSYEHEGLGPGGGTVVLSGPMGSAITPPTPLAEQSSTYEPVGPSLTHCPILW